MKTKILTMLKNKDGYVSGQDLCKQLGVSRTAIWKVINQLKEEGYQIEAVPNKGYKIVSYPNIITGEEIKSLLRTKEIGKQVKYYEEVDSTNTKAKHLAEAKDAHGLLVVAEQQNSGKGRRGRAWISPKGHGIWMSLILKPNLKPAAASMLTLVTALSVAKTLQQEDCFFDGQKGTEEVSLYKGLEAKIKWPNDIIIHGKKVCGILTEMSSELDYINHIVIGVGINANIEKFPDEICKVATSLSLENKKQVQRSHIIATFLELFEMYYNRFLIDENLDFMMEEYNQCLVNYKKEVKIVENSQEYTGIAEGITRTGELKVILSDGTRKEIQSGEVSVRGLYGYV